MTEAHRTEEQNRGDDAAFPIIPPLDEHGQAAAGYYCQQYGLTKRERFALAAMQGLAPAYAQGGDFMEEHVAKGAVKLADALLKELAK